jgi:transposase-like protein
MASISPSRIELTEQQRRELKRRAQAYTSPYCQVIRAKIILMSAAGLANNEIAARLDTSPQVVHRWRRRFSEQGLEGLMDNRRPGRPVTFGPAVAVSRGQAACL